MKQIRERNQLKIWNFMINQWTNESLCRVLEELSFLRKYGGGNSSSSLSIWSVWWCCIPLEFNTCVSWTFSSSIWTTEWSFPWIFGCSILISIGLWKHSLLAFSNFLINPIRNDIPPQQLNACNNVEKKLPPKLTKNKLSQLVILI